MMATSLVCAAAMGSIPLAAAYGRLTLMHLWVAAFVVGSCHVVGMAASLSYIPHLLPPHRLMEANSKLASANTLADIGGPALAGALIDLIGAARAVAADAVSCLVTAWCTWSIRSPEAAPSPYTEKPNLRSETRAGLAYTWRHPLIGPLVTMNAITSTILAGTNAIWVVYLIRELHRSPQAFAVVMSAGASGGFLASLTTPRLTTRYGAGRGGSAGGSAPATGAHARTGLV